MTAKEIYNAIVKNDLYDFGAQDPAGVVTVQLKIYCEGIKISNATPIKYFTVEQDEKGNSIYNLKLKRSPTVGAKKKFKYISTIINDLF